MHVAVKGKRFRMPAAGFLASGPASDERLGYGPYRLLEIRVGSADLSAVVGHALVISPGDSIEASSSDQPSD